MVFFQRMPLLLSFEMNWIHITVIVTITSLVIRRLLPVWRRYKETVSAMKDIDCDPPHWLFGHLLKVRPDKKSFDQYQTLLHKYPKCQPLWLGPFAVYLQGYHPDFMKTILSTDEPKDDFGYRYLRPWVGDGLLTSHGDKWKRNRRLLTPAFHFEILKKYLDCMNRSTTELLNIWTEKFDTNHDFIEVEMFRDISRMTLDSILRCIMSKESGCQRDENNEYLKAVKCLTESVMKRLFNPLYFTDFVYHLSPSGRAYKRALATAHKYTSTVIDERRNSLSRSDADDLDFLDILLKAKDDQGKGLSRQEICDEVDTFVFEGHDTVSSGISWAMYNLAAHPDLQEKCRDEVNQILNGRTNIEWEDLTKFSYLTLFIKESMRLYPPVFSIGRTSSKPLLFQRGFGKDLLNTSSELPQGDAKDFSKVFPKNINFGLAIQLLHRNPHIWENPFDFDPERFTPENCAKRPPYAYVPFSAGPRNCIGQNFAMNEMKVVLARTLSTFRIHVNENQPPPEFEPHLILRSRSGIHLKLKRITVSY